MNSKQILWGLLTIIIGFSLKLTYFFFKDAKSDANEKINGKEELINAKLESIEKITEIQLKVIKEEIIKFNKLIKELVTRDALKLVKKEIEHKNELKFKEMQGEVKVAKTLYENAIEEARAIKRQCRTSLGKNTEMLKIILDFAKSIKMQNEDILKIKNLLEENENLLKENENLKK